MQYQRLNMQAIALSLALMLSLPCRAQENLNLPAHPIQQQQPESPRHQDAPAPEPHPELKPLVDAIPNLLSESKYTDALQQADALLQHASEKGDKVGQAYAHRFRALTLQGQNRFEEALPAWEQAERLWSEAGDGAFTVEALLGRAFCLWRTDEAQANELIQQALMRAKAETLRPQAAAQMLNSGGVDWYEMGLLPTAQYLWEQALTIYKRVAPDSPGLASTLNYLGIAAAERGEIEKAQQCFEQALAIRKRFAPNSPSTAHLINNLGNLAADRGDLEQARQYYEQALSLHRRFNPYSIMVARTLHNLGMVAYEQGDLSLAQQYYEQALIIKEQRAPDSPDVASTTSALGQIAQARGDLSRALEYHQRALSIYRRVAPDSLRVATTLNALGSVAYDLGDLMAAKQYFEQALQIHEKLTPNSIGAAITLSNLGNVAREQGESEKAQRYYAQAWAIYERQNSGSLGFANLLNNMSILAAMRGESESAIEYAEQALKIYERIAPDSLETANTLNNIGLVHLSRGHPQRALEPLKRASVIIEAQRQDVTDSEIRALFAERYFSPYSLLALAHLQLNQPARAAETLERSRARSLAETLQQRQLAFAENTPKPLRQLLQQQQQLNAKRLRTYRQLQGTDPKDADTIAQLQRTLRELDQQQRALDERLRKEFPDYANLILPRLLTIQQIQQSLDAGTVLLYHALAEDHLLIVAVSRMEVKGIARKVDGKQLERQVQQLRVALSKPFALRDAAERREWQSWSQQLYAQLVAPVQEMLQNAQRVLLCPDGVLSQLPWAALIVKTENGKPVYWIERVALHLTPSVGVYRQARGVQPARQGAAIAAVWNYTNGKPIDLAQNRRLEVAMVMRRSRVGTVLEDLTHAPDEVAALRKVFGRDARVVENAQATPQRARQLAATARVVHFVCHARADNADPLGSALLLAPAGADVGLLRAGEVLLNWRLRADLVMLSACSTGVGVARRYEGVYSLGRAFLVAGSRSVGMSLWEVPDEATVELMKSFYSRYVQGMAKDAALRQAQVRLLRSLKYADPYFWSAFVLMGDNTNQSLK